MIYMILSVQPSHPSGIFKKVKKRAQKKDIKNSMIPTFFLAICSIKKYDGIKAINSDKLINQLLTNISKPISSIISVGP